MLGRSVLGAVDDAQILPPAALDRRLQQFPPPSTSDESQRFHHHALTAAFGALLPPGRGFGSTVFLIQVHEPVSGGLKNIRISRAQLRQHFQVPEVGFVAVDGPFAGHQMEGGELEIGQRSDRPAVGAVGVDIALDSLPAGAVLIQPGVRPLASGRCRLQGGNHFSQ